jgi:LEA14-like dessication related protein
MDRLTRPVSLPALLIFVVWLGGCTAFYQAPEVTITDVRIVGLGLSAGTAEIHLEVDNPNFYQLEVRRFQYLLEVEGRNSNWSPLAEGVTADTVRLPRRSREDVRLQVPFRYDAVGTAVRNWWETGAMNYRVQGEILARGPMGERELPFRASGSMTP